MTLRYQKYEGRQAVEVAKRVVDAHERWVEKKTTYMTDSTWVAAGDRRIVGDHYKITMDGIESHEGLANAYTVARPSFIRNLVNKGQNPKSIDLNLLKESESYRIKIDKTKKPFVFSGMGAGERYLPRSSFSEFQNSQENAVRALEDAVVSN
jgi:hypothetical protein